MIIGVSHAWVMSIVPVKTGKSEDKDQTLSNLNLSFSSETKTLINKDILSNMKKISDLTSDMQATINVYKEYYKVDKLETLLCKLNIILHDSFNQAFRQIVDLSLKSGRETPTDPSEPGSADSNFKLGLKELKHRYKKSKGLFREK